MTTKTVNYTETQTAELVKAYTDMPNAETVAAFAEKFGKSVKSIVAKLSREGVYKKAEYVGKTGAKPIKKDEIASQFMDKFGLTENEADSLGKANKSALLKILAKLEG